MKSSGFLLALALISKCFVCRTGAGKISILRILAIYKLKLIWNLVLSPLTSLSVLVLVNEKIGSGKKLDKEKMGKER